MTAFRRCVHPCREDRFDILRSWLTALRDAQCVRATWRRQWSLGVFVCGGVPIDANWRRICRSWRYMMQVHLCASCCLECIWVVG